MYGTHVLPNKTSPACGITTIEVQTPVVLLTLEHLDGDGGVTVLAPDIKSICLDDTAKLPRSQLLHQDDVFPLKLPLCIDLRRNRNVIYKQKE